MDRILTNTNPHLGLTVAYSTGATDTLLTIYVKDSNGNFPTNASAVTNFGGEQASGHPYDILAECLRDCGKIPATGARAEAAAWLQAHSSQEVMAMEDIKNWFRQIIAHWCAFINRHTKPVSNSGTPFATAEDMLKAIFGAVVFTVDPATGDVSGTLP